MRAKTFGDLRAMSREELIKLFDDHISNTVVGLNAISHEIERREAAEQTAEMLRISGRVESLTRLSVIVAAVSLATALLSLLIALGVV
jgi:hypothetical protein